MVRDRTSSAVCERVFQIGDHLPDAPSCIGSTKESGEPAQAPGARERIVDAERATVRVALILNLAMFAIGLVAGYVADSTGVSRTHSIWERMLFPIRWR